MTMLWPILMRCLRSRKKLAVVDDQRSYSYGQVLGGSVFMAAQIDEATAKRHVGVMLPTSGAFPIALLGAWLAKKVVVPLNYLLSMDELRYVIEDSGIDTIVTAGPMLDFLGGADKLPQGVKLLRMEEVDFTGFPPLRWPPRYRNDDLAVILYTSGTSGRPKGVMLSHGNLRTNVDASIEHARITAADTFLGVLPQFHSFGLTALTLIPLRIGAKVVYSARFIPKRIVGLIKRHKPDIVMAVPSMYGALLSVKSAEPDDFASIRLAISGGEPLPDATFQAFKQRLSVHIYEGYGLTETSPVSNWSTPWQNRLHSVGPAIPGVEVIVVDENDRPLPPNKEGEILITGPNIMKGYYQLPDQTQQVFTEIEAANGRGGTVRKRFFRSGDIGRLDEDGYLYITGRKKEMLIIGGENVFPREIEEVLNRHESVKDSAVIGKMDDIRGEIPIAFIELKEEAEFDETALRKWCRDNLAQYKVPRDIRVVEELPRNPTGKIMRRSLKAD